MTDLHETAFPREIFGGEVSRLPSGRPPPRTELRGTEVTLEPLDPARHTAELWDAGHASEPAQAIWRYLPDGPFPDQPAFGRWIRGERRLPRTPVVCVSPSPLGSGTRYGHLPDIEPAHGVIEIGYIMVRPRDAAYPGRHRDPLPAHQTRHGRSRLPAHAVALQRAQRQVTRCGPSPRFPATRVSSTTISSSRA